MRKGVVYKMLSGFRSCTDFVPENGTPVAGNVRDKFILSVAKMLGLDDTVQTKLAVELENNIVRAAGNFDRYSAVMRYLLTVKGDEIRAIKKGLVDGTTTVADASTHLWKIVVEGRALMG